MQFGQIMGRESTLMLHHKAMIVLVCAMAYVGAFQLNQILFSDLLFTHRVHWIYLPSGLRLLLVLLFFELGALGIFSASCFISYYYFSQNDPLFVGVLSLISAGVPLVVRAIAVRWFGLNVNLKGLTTQIILKMSIALSVLSAGGIQLWFFVNGKTTDVVSAFAVMAVGKFLGTVLVLWVFSFLVSGWRIRLINKG